MKFLTKYNIVTRKALGSIGRPVASAGAIGGGLYALTGRPALSAGVGIGVTIAGEGVLFAVGRDADVVAEDVAGARTRILGRLDNLAASGVPEAVERANKARASLGEIHIHHGNVSSG